MNVFKKKWVIWTLGLISLIIIIFSFQKSFMHSSLHNTSQSSIIVLSDNVARTSGIQWILSNEKTIDLDDASFTEAVVQHDFSLLEKSKYDLVYISALDKGMSKHDSEQLRKHLLYDGGTVVVEHSVFDTVTRDEVRYNLETLLHVRWTGWKGKAFTSETISDLPDWLHQMYEKRYNAAWPYKENGVVFINSFNEDIVVLTDVHFNSHQASIKVINQSKSMAINDVSKYDDWFTVFEPAAQEDVHAQFQMDLTLEGQALMEKHNVPMQFPAVVEYNTATYSSYLLAGEFSKTSAINSSNRTVLHNIFNISHFDKSMVEEHYVNVFEPTFSFILNNVHKNELLQKSNALTYIESDNYLYNTRSREGRTFTEIYRNGQWEDFVTKGVNLGMGKPGYYPGEAAITRDEYFRWFQQIGEMNANIIRVYTLQSPDFYQALYEYNQIATSPLYLFQGAWVEEELIAQFENMFVDKITQTFYEEIRNVIQAVYGDISISQRAGHAYGDYTYDVSDYLMGWIIGIEFSGYTVKSTNEMNAQVSQYDGMYIYTDHASPFEIWLAESMDYTVKYEIEHYKKAHLISYTNWPTTDLLEHPIELFVDEDMAEINPNHIHTKESFLPGQFYSFHIYPYYPDFIDEEYGQYVDKTGKKNAYAGYLNDLKQELNMPSIVTEYGIPASRGITHTSQNNRNQGGHSEQEQGFHLSNLYEDILSEGYGGGLIFGWQDEWFKRTWNTMDFDNEDRRPYWSNFQTNEQYFGLLAFESGKYETAIHMDGNVNDWEVLHIEPFYKALSSEQNLQKAYIYHDARYLYLRLDYNKLDVQNIETQIMLDTIADQGIKAIPNTNAIHQSGYDFMIDINSKDDIRLVIDSYYDTHYYLYGHILEFIDRQDYVSTKNNGIFHPIRLILSREYYGIGENGEKLHRPLEEVDVGMLKEGNSHPADEQYNSISDYYINEEEGIIELRITWLSLNFKDPSQLEVIADFYKDDNKIFEGTITDGIRLAIVNFEQQQIEALPADNSGKLDEAKIMTYSWLTWDHPLYHERLKKSYYAIRELYARY